MSFRCLALRTIVIGLFFISLASSAEGTEGPNSSNLPQINAEFELQAGVKPSTLFIEGILNQNEDFQKRLNEYHSTVNTDYQNLKSSTIDCSAIYENLPSAESSIYVSVNSFSQHQIKNFICNTNEKGLKNIVLLPADALGNEKNAEKIFATFFSVFNGFSKIVEVNLCETGNLDVSKYCGHRVNRMLYTTDEQTIIDEYWVRQSNNSDYVPDSVQYVIDVVLTESVIGYLIDELYSYAIYNASNPVTLSVTDYSEVQDAILAIMNRTIVAEIHIEPAAWDKLYSITSSSLNVLSPQQFDSKAEFNVTRISLMYLDFYRRNNSISCAADSFYSVVYPNAVHNTFELLTSLYAMVNYYSGFVVTFSQNIDFPPDSSEDKRILSEIRHVDGANISSCSCDFCQTNVAVFEVEIIYKGLGYGGDLHAYRAYNVGDYSDSGNLTYPVLGSNSNCLNLRRDSRYFTEGTIHAYSDDSNYFSTNMVNNGFVDEGVISINFTSFGVFAPVLQCDDGLVLEAGDSFECSSCNTNCTCVCPGTCDTCIEGFYEYAAYNESCGCMDRHTGVNCSECVIGFQDNATDNTSCSICAEGFTNNASDNTNCSICDIRFTDNLTDNTRCSICSEGFANNPADNTKCSICDTGFTNNSTDNSACSICDIGFTDSSSGKRCSECIQGFADSETYGRCSVCAAHYDNSSEGICDICVFGFDLSTNCSECLTGFDSSSSSATTCDICAEGYGRTSNNSCEYCDTNCTCDNATECSGCIHGYVYNDYSDDVNGTGNCTKGYQYVQEENIISKYVSSGFTSIEIELNKDIITDGISIVCSSFFDNYEILGTNAKCRIKGKRSLVITLGDDFTVSETNHLDLAKTFTISSDVYVLDTISIAVVFKVQPSINAVISGTSKISFGCGTSSYTVRYSATQSYGSLRSRFTYSWDATTTSSDITLTEGSSTSEHFYVTVTATADGTFNITLIVNNGIVSDTAVLVVSVTAAPALKITLDAGENTEFSRKEHITITASVGDKCGCSGKYDYDWSISPNVYDIDKENRKLRIKKNTLSGGDYTITVTVTCRKDTSITGQASIVITIKHSDLVVRTNKGDQYISDSKNLKIDGGDSYDPDGYSITYSWTMGSTVIGTDSSVTIPYTSFNTLTSFQVTLTISSSVDSRQASKVHVFYVIKNPLSISMYGPTDKVSISSMVIYYGFVTGTNNEVTYTWELTSGPSTDPSIRYKNFLVIMPGQLLSGYSYTYTLTGSAGSNSISSIISFTVNIGPTCDNSLTISPDGPYTKSTKVTIETNNCVDGDNEDYPLIYFLALQKQKNRYISLTNTYNPIFTDILLPKGTSKIRVDICDVLLDCTFVISDLSVSRQRRLKTDESDLNEYLENKIDFGPVFAIVNSLTQEVKNPELLDLMWSDYIEEYESELGNEKLTEQLASIVLEFISPPQNEKLMTERFSKYAEYLIGKLELVQRVSLNTEQLIAEICERLVSVDYSEETALLALRIMASSFSYLDVLRSPEFKKVGQMSLYQIEEFENELDTIQLENLGFTLKKTGFGINDIVRFEAALFSFDENSDFVYLSATSNSYIADYKLENYEELKELGQDSEGFVISMPYDDSEKITCEPVFSTNQEDCQVLKPENGFVQISVKKSGFYKIVSTGETAQKAGSFYNFYIVFSLIVFGALSMMLLMVSGKDSEYVYDVAQSTSRFSEANEKGLENFNAESKVSKCLSKIIITSLFVNDPVMSKKGKVLILINSLVFAVFLQTLLLQTINIDALAIGIISALLTLPLSAFLSLCFNYYSSHRLKAVGYTITCLTLLTSLIYNFVSQTAPQFYISFISGLITEIFICQCLILPTLRTLLRI